MQDKKERFMQWVVMLCIGVYWATILGVWVANKIQTMGT